MEGFVGWLPEFEANDPPAVVYEEPVSGFFVLEVDELVFVVEAVFEL